MDRNGGSGAQQAVSTGAMCVCVCARARERVCVWCGVRACARAECREERDSRVPAREHVEQKWFNVIVQRLVVQK